MKIKAASTALLLGVSTCVWLPTYAQDLRARVFVKDSNNIECDYGWSDVKVDKNNKGHDRIRANNTSKSHGECANQVLRDRELRIVTGEGDALCERIESLKLNGLQLQIDTIGDCRWPGQGPTPEPVPPPRMTCKTTASITCKWLPGYEPPGTPKTPNNTRVNLGNKTHVYEFKPMDPNANPSNCKTNPPAGKISIKEAGDAISKHYAITTTPGQTRPHPPNCGGMSVTGEVTFNPKPNASGTCHAPINQTRFWSIKGGGSVFLRVDNFGGC